MEIAVREMTGDDRRIAAGWMTTRISGASGSELLFPLDMLPTHGLTAFCASGIIWAVATLCLEKTAPIAVCGFAIANPGNSPQQSSEALRILLADMGNYAKACGAKHLITTFGNRGINRIVEKLGFRFSEEMKSYYKFVR